MEINYIKLFEMHLPTESFGKKCSTTLQHQIIDFMRQGNNQVEVRKSFSVSDKNDLVGFFKALGVWD